MINFVKDTEDGFIPYTDQQVIDMGIDITDPDQIAMMGFSVVEYPEKQENEIYTCIDEYEEGKFRMRVERFIPSLDIDTFKNDVKQLFGVRMFVIDERWGVMNDNLKFPMLLEHYETIITFMDGWLMVGKIEQQDFDNFETCFSNQGITITDFRIN